MYAIRSYYVQDGCLVGHFSSLHFLFLWRICQRHPPEGVVHQHRGQQHHADDQVRPVAVDIGEIDALIDDGEGQRAEEDADHRAEASYNFV